MIPKTDIPGLRGKSLRNPGMIFHETGLRIRSSLCRGIRRGDSNPPRRAVVRGAPHAGRDSSPTEDAARQSIGPPRLHTRRKRRKTPPGSRHTSAVRQRRTPGTGVGRAKPSAGSSQRTARNEKPATPASGDMLRPASFNRPPDPPAYASPILGPAPGTGFGMGISILPIELS